MFSDSSSSSDYLGSSDEMSSDRNHYDECDGSRLTTTNNDSQQLEKVVIKQFVNNIIDFSSQYGSDYSISYTAFNITGKPCKYPDYGDFPETFAMVGFLRLFF